MKTASAPGKIILSGEYAVLFGYSGIALPSSVKLHVEFTEDPNTSDLEIAWGDLADSPEWAEYLKTIIARCGKFGGKLRIHNKVPLNKGMGSSTALIIALVRCLVGDDRDLALQIEDELNPGHSGIDFAVIWNEKPIKFTKGSPPEEIDISQDLLHGQFLVDTGKPGESTTELIEHISAQKDNFSEAFAAIGSCTELLEKGEDFAAVIKAHNRAQQSLGIVTEEAKNLITKIEHEGGAAKVLGAGALSGGCGMILAINVEESVADGYPILRL